MHKCYRRNVLGVLKRVGNQFWPGRTLKAQWRKWPLNKTFKNKDRHVKQGHCRQREQYSTNKQERQMVFTELL